MRGIEGAPLLPRGRFGLESARFGLGGSGHIWHAAFYRLVDAALFVPAMPRTGEGYELPRPRAGIAAGMRPDAYNFFILISMNYMENGGEGEPGYEHSPICCLGELRACPVALGTEKGKVLEVKSQHHGTKPRRKLAAAHVAGKHGAVHAPGTVRLL